MDDAWDDQQDAEADDADDDVSHTRQASEDEDDVRGHDALYPLLPELSRAWQPAEAEAEAEATGAEAEAEAESVLPREPNDEMDDAEGLPPPLGR